jgi:transcriptional regulator with XRE-family HTH domain
LKKKRNLSPEDLGVARRLREARNRLNLSQANAARQLGISREALASYEDGRAPVRFDFALRFCWQFVFSEEWLALGEKEILAEWEKTDPGPQKHVWPPAKTRECMSLLFDPAFHKIKPGTPFVDAYREHLRPVFWAVYSAHIASFGIGPRILISVSPGEDQLKNYFHALLEFWIQFYSEPLKKFRFLMSLARAARKIKICLDSNELTEQEREKIKLDGWNTGSLSDAIEDNSDEMENFIQSQAPQFLANFSASFMVPLPMSKMNKNKVQGVLDSQPCLKEDNAGMKITSLSELVKKLRLLTKPRGMKADLAKNCNVSRQAVDQWLAESSSPSAEAVFAAIEWVQKQSKA